MDLSENNITLRRGDFNYPLLVYLKLSHNELRRLPEEAFIGLENLAVLDLSNNNLGYSNVSIPPDIFKPLRNLKILNLGFNDEEVHSQYCDEIFQYLGNLEELTIDTFETHFGSGFKHLVSLRVLNLSGKSAYCNIKMLCNDSLLVFNSSKISSLDLSYCELLSEIQTNAFAPLKHLSNLSLENDKRLGLHKSLSSLYSLQGTNMSSVNFKNVDLTGTLVTHLIHDEQLTAENLKYLENICISELNLAENHILFLNYTSLMDRNNILSRCLRRLDLHTNMIYGNYDIPSMVTLNLDILEYLDTSHFTCYQKTQKNSNAIYNSKSSDPVSEVILYFPRNLKVFILDAAYENISFTTDTRFTTNNCLETFSLSYYNYVTITAVIEGLIHLKTFKLAHNNNMTLSVSIFDTFPSLENLYLNDVSLPEDFLCQHGSRMFANLTNLILLDLSGIGINCLSKGIFKHSPKLQTLILSNNQFTTIPFTITDCPNLLTLKLNFNEIEFLNESITKSLDDHAKKIHFKLGLSGNKFICVCGKSLYFLSWLQENNYTSEKHQYSCTLPNGTSVAVTDISAQYLWRQCSGEMWLLIGISLFAINMLGTISSFLVLKRKTQVIYFFKNLLYKCATCPARSDYKFDICVCYAEKDWRQAFLGLVDPLQRRYGYRIYLHDRDSVPGEPIVDSIMYSINNSWRIILLFTQNVMDDGWSWFTIHAAVRAVTWRTPYRLILLKDPGMAYLIPDCILNAVDEDRIMTTPDREDEKSWDALNRLITKR